MSIDKEGGRAWQMMYLWSLQVVRRQALAGVLTPPIHAQLNKELSLIADCCGNLFACSYQVLPFIYTQLVSFACTIYLVAIAFLKGVHFTQDESLTYGLIIPFINVFLTTFTIFGLLEVGDTIMDPFGNDPEDYAIVHFVEHTAQACNEAMLSPDAPPPARERDGARSEPEGDRLASTAMLAALKETVEALRQQVAAGGSTSGSPQRRAGSPNRAFSQGASRNKEHPGKTVTASRSPEKSKRGNADRSPSRSTSRACTPISGGEPTRSLSTLSMSSAGTGTGPPRSSLHS